MVERVPERNLTNPIKEFNHYPPSPERCQQHGQWIQSPGFAQFSVEQGVRRAQPTAARALQTGVRI
jgi:hypothetical protein